MIGNCFPEPRDMGQVVRVKPVPEKKVSLLGAVQIRKPFEHILEKQGIVILWRHLAALVKRGDCAFPRSLASLLHCNRAK